MIRFIIETASSKADIYGNRYHVATITSAKTCKYLHLIGVGGPSNVVLRVKKALSLDWPAIHSTNCENMPIREFGRLRKRLESNPDSFYEHQLTAEALTALEQNTN